VSFDLPATAAGGFSAGCDSNGPRRQPHAGSPHAGAVLQYGHFEAVCRSTSVLHFLIVVERERARRTRFVRGHAKAPEVAGCQLMMSRQGQDSMDRPTSDLIGA
jgi:hypothetical protein